MSFYARARRPLAALLGLAFLAINLQLPLAQAALIGTEEVLDQGAAHGERQRLHAVLAREDVITALRAQGVDLAAVRERVAALSDAEAGELAARLEQAPAGAGIVGAAVLVFLVLLFTDLMGYTDVFPFTKKGSARR